MSSKRGHSTPERLPLALRLHQSGQHDRAEALYIEILKARPRNAEATFFLAMLRAQKGDIEAAAAGFGRAAVLKPDLVDAHFNHGVALAMLKRFEAALACYDKVLAIEPSHVEALNNRGGVLRELNRLAESLASYDRALAINPAYADALNNRGVTLVELDRPAEALASYDRAIAGRPGNAETLFNRGAILNEIGRSADALSSYEQAIRLKPDYADAHLNMGLCKLLLGDFAGGWPLYEWRLRIPEPKLYRTFALPVWRGDAPIAGKTLFLYAEQGLGTIIQFARYAKLVQAAGARVIMALPKSLHRLMRSLDPAIEIVDVMADAPAADYQCSLLSLPLAFATAAATVPNSVPYLAAEPERIAMWRERIGPDGMKIGINWQGSTGKIDIGRSFAVQEFAPIAALPGVRLISLQKNAGVEQLQSLPAGMTVQTLGDDFDTGPDAFIDSAAVIACLDLVITSDTAIAHLAGALAADTWVALKHVPDWRFMLDRSDSPWYPTMRLFRQPQRGDWAGAFEAMRRELAAR